MKHGRISHTRHHTLLILNSSEFLLLTIFFGAKLRKRLLEKKAQFGSEKNWFISNVEHWQKPKNRIN